MKKMFAIGWLGGLCVGLVVGAEAEHRFQKYLQQRSEAVIQPLKVTILKDGGAKLKVKSCVEQ